MKKISVVTGVSGGIGAALASELLSRGFTVVGVGRRAASELSSQSFRLVECDLSDIESVCAVSNSLFAELASANPEMVCVWNNAAQSSPTATFGAIEPQVIGQALTVNLLAPTVISNAFVKAFASSSADRRLINLSSGAAEQNVPGWNVYCVAKCGLEMLTKGVASENGLHGITSIAVRPGVVDTPMQAYLRSQDASMLPPVAMFKEMHETGALASPVDTAKKLVEGLLVSPIENGRVYDISEL